QILESKCAECHNRTRFEGGLDLTTQAALLKGGETGPAIQNASPEKSLLYQLATHRKKPAMPHKRDKLSPEELLVLADWIRAGSPYERELKPPVSVRKAFAVTEADRKHWAFQPIARPEPPAGPAAHPIDRFIQARLRDSGIPSAPQAPRETLLRRVTLDLLGLPPTPAETEAFANDRSADAWEKVIDRLLGSPHYGERWGRHWLDLARFAETDGFEHDAVRPHSWRYRDYVIRSLNADKPFDRFVREQIAGDELWPSDSEALVATGFNLLGADMVDSSDQVQRRLNTLSDMTDVTASVFLGLTLGCARCHDHKFEPLSQKDYYRLMAFFTPAAFRRETPVPTVAERAACEAEMKAYAQTPALKELGEIEAPVRQKLRDRKLEKLNDEMRAAVRTPPDQRTVEQANLALETEPHLEITEKELELAIPADQKARRKALQEEVRRLPKPPQLPMAMTLAQGKPAKTFVLGRGEYSMPGDEVAPGFPEVLGAAPSGPERTALADWISSPVNPLTARVMANRIWQHHFGRGLVPSPSEFGPRGQAPTHPELLDWLASEFVRTGWSLKSMHRLILTSETYRQSSVWAPSTRQDPENRLYGRMNRLRLEGEVIRDSLLAISGRLNPEMFGPGVFPPVPADVLKGSRGWTVSANPRDHVRRSIYIFARRNLRFPFLEVFDAPDSNLSCPERGRSTTAPQSLTLLNAEDVVEAARATAARLNLEAKTPEARVDRAYRLVLGRPPSAAEAALSRDFLARSSLVEFCRALFNLNAFVYAE
ncbi:MAG TPA: PSD1 and planctomycete cytochrome C domain-containing protein, partial [Planctomycetota bacterium]|nr:PSD1 and planctomycete cytochrome C domain-containing protein [Planctomycetota bacterium]